MPSQEKEIASLSIKDRLELYGIRPKKGLGQHFLISRGALSKIVEAADLTPEDLVIEVGAGLGILTSELALKAGEVLAVEMDVKMAELLQKLFISSSKVKIIKANILDMAPEQLLGKYASKKEKKAYKVVANIPYYITSPIIRHFLEASLRPVLMVLLVQKEVGKQIIALPGETNLLSLSVQLYAHPRLVAEIPAGNFHPRPKVNSVALRLDVYKEPKVAEKEIPAFFQVARAGFCAPRKQIKNTLSQGLKIDVPKSLEMLAKAGISPERRPQTLSFEEWIRLKDAFLNQEC